jgi:hypothetical protein
MAPSLGQVLLAPQDPVDPVFSANMEDHFLIGQYFLSSFWFFFFPCFCTKPLCREFFICSIQSESKQWLVTGTILVAGDVALQSGSVSVSFVVGGGLRPVILI